MRTLFLLLLGANALYAAWVWFAVEAPSDGGPVARELPHYPARLELASEYRPVQPQTAVADASPAMEPVDTAATAETTESVETAATAATAEATEAPETAAVAETARAAWTTEPTATAESGPSAPAPVDTDSEAAVPKENEALAATPGGATSEAVPSAHDAAPSAHCVRIGRFSTEGAARTALERLRDQLPDGALVTVPVVVRSNFWVHIPPRANDEEARAVVARLTERGVESFVIRDDPALRNGISLGVFRDTASAERHAARFADIGYPVAIHEAAQTRPSFMVQGTLSADMAAVEAALGQGLAIEELACPVVSNPVRNVP